MLKSLQAHQNKLTGGKAASIEKPLKYTMSSSSLYGTDVVVEEHRQLVDSIARHVLYGKRLDNFMNIASVTFGVITIKQFSDCSASVPVMSTNVVAFLLLNKFRDGCTLDKLVETFDWLRQDLESRNKDVAFCGETIDIINHAVSEMIITFRYYKKCSSFLFIIFFSLAGHFGSRFDNATETRNHRSGRWPAN